MLLRTSRASLTAQCRRVRIATLCGPGHHARLPALRPNRCLHGSHGRTASNHKDTYSRQLTLSDEVPKPTGSDIEALQQLREGLASSDIQAVLRAYSSVRGKDLLGSDDAQAIITALHDAMFGITNTHIKLQTPREALEDAMIYLSRDIYIGLLPTRASANAKLLDFFQITRNYSLGSRHWEWLVSRDDDDLVSPAVYASYIVLRSYQGLPGSLDEAESLFNECIERFPGTFLGYHLADNAVLPDRKVSQPVPFVPRSLLRAIAQARLIRRNSTKAYLALDTTLRLLPADLTSKDFSHFIRYRPVREGLSLFLMSCEFAKGSRHSDLNDVLVKLRAVGKDDPSLIVTSIRASLVAQYAFHISGQQFSQRNLTEFLIVLLQTFTSSQISFLAQPAVSSRIQHLVTDVLTTFEGMGIVPSVVCARTIIRAVKNRGQPETDIGKILLLSVQVAAAEDSGDTYRDIRDAIELAGWIKDESLLLDAFNELKKKSSRTAKGLTQGELSLLLMAALQCGEVDLYKRKLADMFPPSVIDRRLHSQRLRYSGDRGDGAAGQVHAELEEGLDKIEADFELFKHAVVNHEADVVHPRSLPALPQQSSAGSSAATEPDLRQFYEAVTSATGEPAAVSAANGVAVAADEPRFHGLPISEVRYRNWVQISALMTAGDQFHQDYAASIRESRERGEVPGHSDALWAEIQRRNLVGCSSQGLSDVLHIEDGKVQLRADAPVQVPSVDIATIKRLRGL